ncbi:MAG TPA: hypothetical protein VFT05_16255 [Burkholderiaceae bacterium]|nr:hypothetical protein [Burkholderiaceae bacterium]
MLPSPSHQRLLARRVLPLLLVFNLLLLVYYVVADYQLVVHSDSAVMNLLAQEIHDTGHYFPPGWNYANGDLWVGFTQTIIVPLLGWLPNTYALHALSGLVTAALVLLTAWCVGAMLDQSRLARLLGLVVLAGGISVNMAENLYGQAAYGVLFWQAGLLAVSGWRALQSEGAARWRWHALFAVLAVLVFWSNPSRALAFFGLPLAAATLALQGVPGLPSVALVRQQRRRAALLLAVLAAGLVAGVALHSHVLRSVGSSGLAPATWLGFDGLLRNASGTVRGLLSLLGGLPPEGQKVISLPGVWHALRLLAALALLCLLPWAVRRACRPPLRRARVFFAVYGLTAAGLNLFILLATSLPDMADPAASVRYLVPSLLCILLLLVGIAVDDFKWSRPAHPLAVLALLVLGLSGPLAYRVERSPGYFPKAGLTPSNPYARFAARLEQEGLQYGYASFWNAGRISLLSGQRVRVRQVTLEAGLPMPLRHLSSDRWYQGAAWQGPSFLMQTREEAQATDWAQMARYAGQPSRTLDFQGWHVTVYPHNLAAVLPLWDASHPVALDLPVTAATPHHIGQLTEQDHALQAEPGQSGHLRYGPHRPAAAGRYVASFELERTGAGVTDFGVLDVAVDGGANVVAAQAIGAGNARISLPFTLSHAVADLELRVWSNGAGRLTLRGVTLEMRSPRTDQ